MSAPLVVNTKDGAVWTRRAVTAAGVSLYALAGVCSCPEYVMASFEELAVLGIVGSAFALPMPVGAQPQTEARAKVAKLIGDAKPATDALLVHLGESVRDRLAHEHPTWEDLFCLNLTSYMGERMGPVLRRLVEAEARVAELEAQRAADHATWRHDLRTARSAQEVSAARIAELEAGRSRTAGHVEHLATTLVARTEDLMAVEASADALTALLAPTQALTETKPICRCGEPDADPYACEAEPEDCVGEFSELNPFGGSGPVEGVDAKVSRGCGRCDWRSSEWHVADGSAEAELYEHTTTMHGAEDGASC